MNTVSGICPLRWRHPFLICLMWSSFSCSECIYNPLHCTQKKVQWSLKVHIGRGGMLTNCLSFCRTLMSKCTTKFFSSEVRLGLLLLCAPDEECASKRDTIFDLFFFVCYQLFSSRSWCQRTKRVRVQPGVSFSSKAWCMCSLKMSQL